MEFEDNNTDFSGSSEQPKANSFDNTQPQIVNIPNPPKKRSGWRIFWGIVTVLSVLTNFLLFFLLIGVIFLFASGQKNLFMEQVLQEGPRTSKIAVITLSGIINDEQSVSIKQQIDMARGDGHVKGLILRINSPGGTVSASDQIHNALIKYKQEQGKPIVAFMQTVAASGGYYSAVACDEIVSEPTTITGSIGVIMGYMVLQELLEGKLGIQPVVVKSGEKKDWPSSFSPPTDEQIQYLQKKLIEPSYERFVSIVDDGREMLTIDDVKRLADGSIYGAQEALDEGLIDSIGYMDKAIERVTYLAGIEQAQVVEYAKPFSLSRFLSSESKSIFNIDRESLYELNVPKVMYLWTGF